MKRTFLLISICLTAHVATAQDTCEARVDAHPCATTMERVAYCLHPQPQEQGSNYNYDLVFSGVSSQAVLQEPEAQRVTARSGYFKPGKMDVAQDFVDTGYFPKLTDGRVSEQDKLARREAVEAGKCAAQNAYVKTACEPQDEAAQRETPAGLKTRQHKPGRHWVQETRQVETTEETAPVQDPTLADTADTYEEQPAAQVSAGQQDIAVGTYSYAPATGN